MTAEVFAWLLFTFGWIPSSRNRAGGSKLLLFITVGACCSHGNTHIVVIASYSCGDLSRQSTKKKKLPLYLDGL